MRKYSSARKRVYKKRVYKKKTMKKTGMATIPQVKSIVKRYISNQNENKEVCNTDNFWEIYQAGGITITTSTVAILSPTITQSVTENGRIGNSVTLKNLFLRGYMSVYSQVLNSQVPQQVGQWNVRLFIGKLKQSILPPQTADLNQLLRTGGSTQAFDSQTPLSLVRTVNTELFTVYYDKIHKIGMQNGNNLSVATGIHNNDYKLSKMIRINCTKFMKKKLIFNDSNNQPTNCGLYMWAGLVDSLGSTYTSLSPLVNFTYDLEYSYEDA